MAKKLVYQDFKEIIYGATFLGAGGGGSACMSMDLMNKLGDEGKEIAMPLISLDEMDPNAYAVMVAELGSPLEILKGELGPDMLHAYYAFKKALAAEGKDVKYLYSGEMGGLNTFVPMVVSLLSSDDYDTRIPFVDVDGNGRAVPEIGTSLNSLRGFMATPIGFGTDNGNEIAAYPINDNEGEKIARSLSSAYNMKIGFATWGMKRDELKENAAVGYVSFAQMVGKVLLNAMENSANTTNLLAELQAIMEIRELFSAKVEKIEIKADGGFDFGTTTLKTAEGEIYTIDFKNENLIVRKQNGETIITAPELICFVDNATGEPLTNADTKEGMTLRVFASPAPHAWWREDKKAYQCWLPLLAKAGYSGSQVKY